MRISERFIEEIKTNNDLSLDLAKKAGISQSGILKQAERRSKLLMLPMYVEVYKSYGFTDEQIFDYEADESRNSLQCDSSPQSRGTAEA
ncbi:hypothetical protein ACILFS_00855 [Capnocytophaga canimorsus]|uniref:hypothetical protein n=1 Tax=Capnocytophaga canimorsus TaxID=28188 RepID=UPI0037CEE4E2